MIASVDRHVGMGHMNYGCGDKRHEAPSRCKAYHLDAFSQAKGKPASGTSKSVTGALCPLCDAGSILGASPLLNIDVLILDIYLSWTMDMLYLL